MSDGPERRCSRRSGASTSSATDAGAPAVLYVDLHLVHEVTSPQAFDGLRARGPQGPPPRSDRGHDGPLDADACRAALAVRRRRRPKRSSRSSRRTAPSSASRSTISTPTDQGIVHVIGPELGRDAARARRSSAATATPRRTAPSARSPSASARARSSTSWRRSACSSASRRRSRCASTARCRRASAPRTSSSPSSPRSAPAARTGHVIEYRGTAIEALDMEERMTVCNMSIEAGARAGMIAPDETTFAVARRPRARAQGRRLGRAPSAHWRTLPTDDGATFDATVTLDASTLAPMITYGTNPGMGMPITGRVPAPASARRRRPRRARQGARLHGADARRRPSRAARSTWSSSASCTNSRIGDLRAAARACSRAARSRRACACSSCRARSHQDARPRPRDSTACSARPAPSGARPGCSMCIAMNGDQLEPRAVRRQHQQPQLRGAAGRAAGARFLACPSPPPPRPSPATSPMPANARREERSMERSRQPFTSRDVVVLPADNVDTDQIIPARFLKVDRARRASATASSPTGAPPPTGRPSPTSPSTGPRRAGARDPRRRRTTSAAARRASTRPGRSSAGGCAPIVAPSFADIFKSNAMKNGLLPVAVDAAVHAAHRRRPPRDAAARLAVDLPAQTLSLAGETLARFEIDPFAKECLVHGIDELGYLFERVGGHPTL